MRIKTSVLVAAAALVALLANTHARTLPPTNSVDNHLDVLAGRAPIEPIIPEPKPKPNPEPEPAPGAPEAPGGAPKVSDGPAHLSISESGLPKPTATPAESVAPTTGPAESNTPTQAKSVAPSATEPKPVAPTGPAQGSDDNPSAPYRRGILGARCALDSGDDSGDDGEPVGAPARARPPSGSWYEFVNDPSKVQNSRTQFNQRINNPTADDIPTGTLSTYALDGERKSNTELIDTEAAGIGSILTELGRRNEISDGAMGTRVDVRSQNPPANGNPTRDEVQDTSFTDDSKMIIVHFSEATNDGTPANEGKMPWDQLAFLQYKQLSGGNIGKLQFIGQSQISNKATLNTMLDAFGHSARSTPQEMGQVMSIRSVQDGAPAG